MVALGLGSLAAGLLIYLADRPVASTYFLQGNIASFKNSGITFGTPGQWLPAFLHVYAFILLTVVIARCQGRQIVAVCMAWFVIDALFECGQHPALAPRLAELVPEWFRGIPVLENTASYFVRGVFDPIDLLFIAFGAVAAYATTSLMMRNRRRPACVP
jgi:hypothetical protein